MKLMSAIAVGTAAAAVVWADAAQPEQQAVTVCMDRGGSAVVFQAQATASQVFARIGVHLNWQPNQRRSCFSGDRIAIRLSDDTPAGQHPGEIAYSMPYEGTLIVVFYDRLLTSLTPSRVPSVLGYVLAHEIAHVLEGISRHSLSGIMKPVWNARDYVAMQRNTLRFTEDDVYLIRRGLEKRAFQASKCDSTEKSRRSEIVQAEPEWGQ